MDRPTRQIGAACERWIEVEPPELVGRFPFTDGVRYGVRFAPGTIPEELEDKPRYDHISAGPVMRPGMAVFAIVVMLAFALPFLLDGGAEAWIAGGLAALMSGLMVLAAVSPREKKLVRADDGCVLLLEDLPEGVHVTRELRVRLWLEGEPGMRMFGAVFGAVLLASGVMGSAGITTTAVGASFLGSAVLRTLAGREPDVEPAEPTRAEIIRSWLRRGERGFSAVMTAVCSFLWFRDLDHTIPRWLMAIFVALLAVPVVRNLFRGEQRPLSPAAEPEITIPPAEPSRLAAPANEG